MSDNNKVSSVQFLNNFYLKIIALITMIIDHVGLVVYPDEIVFRVVGRMAFPIYCFLLVEGFYHTSNIKAYIMRLGIFAIISEIPFNFLVSGTWWDIEHQNVFFTLVIGLVTIYYINVTVHPMHKSMILILGAVIASVLMTDYSFYGIIIVYSFYILRENRIMACVVLAGMSFILSPIQSAAMLAAIPILLYNGKKGPEYVNKKMWKYGFYAVYPIHMLILCFAGRM